MFLLTFCLTVLTSTGDTLHLSPGLDVRVPGLSVLVVVSLPGTAPTGQDVQATAGQAHVIESMAGHH